MSREQLLSAGLGPRTISRRVEAGRLYRLYQGVYAVGRERISQRGEWLAAVLACGDGAVLSHRSAAALWRLAPSRSLEVTVPKRREPPGISIHECGVHDDERLTVDRIPVTTVARTLLDLAESMDEDSLKRAFDEAHRLHSLSSRQLQRVCARGFGRRGLKPLRRIMRGELGPTTASRLEDRIIALCRDHGLPLPETNLEINGREVDAFWPEQKLMVEADSFEFHGHRAAFEGDRARDAAMQVAGYRVIRVTHRRLTREMAKVVAELRHFLAEGRAAAEGP